MRALLAERYQRRLLRRDSDGRYQPRHGRLEGADLRLWRYVDARAFAEGLGNSPRVAALTAKIYRMLDWDSQFPLFKN